MCTPRKPWGASTSPPNPMCSDIGKKVPANFLTNCQKPNCGIVKKVKLLRTADTRGLFSHRRLWGGAGHAHKWRSSVLWSHLQSGSALAAGLPVSFSALSPAEQKPKLQGESNELVLRALVEACCGRRKVQNKALCPWVCGRNTSQSQNCRPEWSRTHRMVPFPRPRDLFLPSKPEQWRTRPSLQHLANKCQVANTSTVPNLQVGN